MDLLKNKEQYFTPEELAVKRITRKNDASINVEQKKVEHSIDVNKYNDLDGLTVKKLDTGFWFIKNREKLVLSRNLAIGLLGVIFWGYFISSFGSYLAFGMSSDSSLTDRIIKSAIPSHEYFLGIGPKNLTLGNVQIFEYLTGKYDFLIEVSNFNPSYWAEVEYTLDDGDKNIQKGKAVVLPNSKKYLAIYSKELDWRPKVVSLNVTSLQWHRIDPHKYGSWDKFKKDRFDNIAIASSSIVLADNSLSEKVNLNTINFKVKNNTGFNYQNASFVIILYSNNRTVGIYNYIAENFYSGAEISPSITFPGAFSNINKVDVVPDINILDESVFLDFK